MTTINSKSADQVTVGLPGDVGNGNPNFKQQLGDADRQGLAGHQALGGDLAGLTYEFVRTSPAAGDIVSVGGVEMPKAQAEKLGAAAASTTPQAQQTQKADNSNQGGDGNEGGGEFDPRAFEYEGGKYDFTSDAFMNDLAADLSDLEAVLGPDGGIGAFSDEELREIGYDPEQVKAVSKAADAAAFAVGKAYNVTADDFGRFLQQTGPSGVKEYEAARAAFMKGDFKPAHHFAQKIAKAVKR